MAEPIFHIAVESVWRDARPTSGYRESTLGATLDEATGETFPHILGPIDRSAVVEVPALPVAPGRPGRSGPQAGSPARP